MQFYFVSLRPGAISTLLDERKQPRLMCFKSQELARKYKAYAYKHKAEFGTWPAIDLSKKDKVVYRFPKKSTTDSNNDILEVTHVTRRELDAMSGTAGVSFFYLHTFECDDLKNMKLSGQEVDGSANDYLFRRAMEKVYLDSG